MCENNGMSIFASANEMHPTPDLSSLAAGYDMPAVIVDGQDVIAVAEAALDAMERARSGGGPTFVEAKCLRFREHDIGTPDLDGWENRDAETLDAMRERDPVRIATERMRSGGVLGEAQIDAVREDALAEVARVEAFADESPIARPAVDELLAGVFAD
jgi:pyruvate dehydrogenase E1 component alpha subunit